MSKTKINAQKLEERLIVKKSDIQGKGLFAVTEIKKGEILCGRLNVRKVKKLGTYVLKITEGNLVEVLGKFKYTNHSKNPNVVYYDNLSVEALRDIHPGEELTHNYGCDFQ